MDGFLVSVRRPLDEEPVRTFADRAEATALAEPTMSAYRRSGSSLPGRPERGLGELGPPGLASGQALPLAIFWGTCLSCSIGRRIMRRLSGWPMRGDYISRPSRRGMLISQTICRC